LRICNLKQFSSSSFIVLRLQYERILAKIWLAHQNSDDLLEVLPEIENLMKNLEKANHNYFTLRQKCELLQIFCSHQNPEEFTLKIEEFCAKNHLDENYQIFGTLVFQSELWFLAKNTTQMSECAQKMAEIDEDNFHTSLTLAKIGWLQYVETNFNELQGQMLKNQFHAVAKKNDRSWEAFFYLAKLSEKNRWDFLANIFNKHFKFICEIQIPFFIVFKYCI